MNFFIPSKLEQQKIASYFCNLDKQISLQTQRLEKLKQIKAACLDKRFADLDCGSKHQSFVVQHM
jgi:type I restriction enzyme S subunit